MHFPGLHPLCAALLLAGSSAAAFQDAERSGAAPAKERGSVEVRFLANEGFLLTAGTKSVLIDGFLAEPYSLYGALPGTVLDDLVQARPPFDSVSVALVSHYHRDHFQPIPAQYFLAAKGDCVLATSPQVIDTLWDADAAAPPEDAVVDFHPGPGEELTFERDGIRVEFLNLSHGTGRFQEVQNLGHVITLGGLKFLHIGDAEIEPKNFAPYDLAARGIDVAFIPYWYFGSKEGKTLVAEHLPGARLIACHIPPADLEKEIAALRGGAPGVLVFREALEARRFLEKAE